jgi:hypothetical protein
MFATIAFWKEERRDQRGSLVLKRMASKLPFLLKTLGIIVKGALNLGSTGGFSTKPNNNVPHNCANLSQNVQICCKVKPESKQGFVLSNYCKMRIRIIYLFLFLYIFSSSTWAQENVLRFAWTPNKEPHLSHYVIYRDTEPGTMKMLDQIPKTDSMYTDDTVEPGVTYYYKLTAVDNSGNESAPTDEVMAFIGNILRVNEDNAVIERFELEQNYPNPFNPSTTIPYSLANNTNVTITIYDLMGKEVIRLVDGFREAGEYNITWNGKDIFSRSVASGVYYYYLVTDEFSSAKMMLLQK